MDSKFSLKELVKFRHTSRWNGLANKPQLIAITLIPKGDLELTYKASNNVQFLAPFGHFN